MLKRCKSAQKYSNGIISVLSVNIFFYILENDSSEVKNPFLKKSGRIEKFGGGKRTSRIASQFRSGFDASCIRPFESESFRCSE